MAEETDNGVLHLATTSSAPTLAASSSPAPARQRKKLTALGKQSDSGPGGPGREKWPSHLKSQSSTWGGNEAFYPTPQQLSRESGSLHAEHELLNAEFKAEAAARTAAAAEEVKRLAATTGFSGGPGPLNTKLKEQAYLSWAQEQSKAARSSRGEESSSGERHELVQLSPGRGVAASTSSGGSASTFGRRKKGRVEPAKVVGPDGKIRLRGVKSTSDIARYCKDIDPYSKKNWAVREAYKNMRTQEHARAAEATWGALRSWYTTDKTLDEWYAGTKGGRSRS